MDTMKLLLGATVAVLVGALALSYQNMNVGVKNASPDEIARLKKQISESPEWKAQNKKSGSGFDDMPNDLDEEDLPF